MAITYTTTIIAARVADQGDLVDVVKEVDASIHGQEGTVSFALPTTVKFEAADPEHFTAFEDLTEAQLIAWVDAQPTVDPIRTHIALVIDREKQKAELEQKPLPWQPAPPPMPEPPVAPPVPPAPNN